MAKEIELEVVGMNYRLTQSTLNQLADDTPIKVKLVREPDNAHDENAVMVVITEKPWAKKHEGWHVGYLKREVAAVIGPAMDEKGDDWPFTDAWITSVDPERGTAEMIQRKPKKKKEIQA